jgi:hypothetical protein
MLTSLLFLSFLTYGILHVCPLSHYHSTVNAYNTGGAPLGYFDWAMIGQLLANGAESAAMFGATAAAMDYCMEKGYISKFPG